MSALREKIAEADTIRPARMDEYAALEALMAASVRGLRTGCYTAQQVDAALVHLFGLDSELFADATYFAVTRGVEYVACGGWSKRRTLYGGDHYAGRVSGLLDPKTEAAKIRAFFVHPDYARQGIGAALLRHCEAEALAHGFTRLEMMSTLPGVPFYSAFGYEPGEPVDEMLPDGTVFPLITMYKTCNS